MTATTAEAPAATTALAFSPMTRRGLAYWQHDLNAELANAARALIECLDDQPYREYINRTEGEHLRWVNRIWLEVLDARSQRGRAGDAMDATNERPDWAGWI